jgi:hypothetical protein
MVGGGNSGTLQTNKDQVRNPQKQEHVWVAARAGASETRRLNRPRSISFEVSRLAAGPVREHEAWEFRQNSTATDGAGTDGGQKVSQGRDWNMWD